MNTVESVTKPNTVRLIKNEVYNNFSRIHKAMTDILVEEGRVQIIQ